MRLKDAGAEKEGFLQLAPEQFLLCPVGGFTGFVEGFEEARQRGKDSLNKLAKSFDLKVETIFTEGDPGHEIVRVAEEINADLIVLGTHGYSGWKRFTIGSVAELVVRHAPCAVLTIRSERRQIESVLPS